MYSMITSTVLRSPFYKTVYTVITISSYFINLTLTASNIQSKRASSLISRHNKIIYN